MGRLKPAISRCVIVSAALLFGLAGAAFAAEQNPDTAEITVKPRDCHRLVAHQPSGDVAYKPGVDAYGRPVKPADLPGTRVIKAPNKITFSITYDALKGLGVSEASSLLSGEASVGEVSYDISKGRLEFNGEPLGDPEIAALAVACKNLGE